MNKHVGDKSPGPALHHRGGNHGHISGYEPLTKKPPGNKDKNVDDDKEQNSVAITVSERHDLPFFSVHKGKHQFPFAVIGGSLHGCKPGLVLNGLVGALFQKQFGGLYIVRHNGIVEGSIPVFGTFRIDIPAILNKNTDHLNVALKHGGMKGGSTQSITHITVCIFGYYFLQAFGIPPEGGDEDCLGMTIAPGRIVLRGITLGKNKMPQKGEYHTKKEKLSHAQAAPCGVYNHFLTLVIKKPYTELLAKPGWFC
jgi:hypothetical protein